MNEYWRQQHDLTTSDKASFVERARAEEDSFLRSLRKVTDRAETRMRERTARQQHAAALRDLNRGPDDVIDDADDSAIQRGMLR